MWLTILWNQRQLIAEILGCLFIAAVAWFFFIHNPKVIKGLEADKAELSRLVKNGQDAIELLNKIQEGKVKINEKMDDQLRIIKERSIPVRSVVIVGGLPLPTVPPAPKK